MHLSHNLFSNFSVNILHQHLRNILKTNSLIWLYGIVLFFISGLTFWACTSEMGAEKAGKVLAEQISTKVSQNPDKKIKLSDFAQFNWDKVYIAHPYTSLDALEKELNINLAAAKFSHINQRDDICLMLFFEEGKFIKPILVPRNIYDFSSIEAEIITRENAVFHIDTGTFKLVER